MVFGIISGSVNPSSSKHPSAETATTNFSLKILLTSDQFLHTCEVIILCYSIKKLDFFKLTFAEQFLTGNPISQSKLFPVSKHSVILTLDLDLDSLVPFTFLHTYLFLYVDIPCPLSTTIILLLQD